MKKPFFANFLENQISKEETNSIQGGATSPLRDNVQTMKYPSDSDADESVVTKPTVDVLHTMKYPSDGDDDTTSAI